MINMMVLRTKDLLPEHIPALHFLARSDVSLAGSTTSGWLCYQVGSAYNVYLKAGYYTPGITPKVRRRLTMV